MMPQLTDRNPAELLGGGTADTGETASSYPALPGILGGGGYTSGNGFSGLSNILMGLGATTMMMDPTGRTTNAGLALVPQVSRQIAATQASQEYQAMTNLVADAEKQSGGDYRKMLQILQDSPFRAQNPDVQKAMFGTIKGLRDKVLAADTETKDSAALQSVLSGMADQQTMDPLTFMAKFRQAGGSQEGMNKFMSHASQSFAGYGFQKTGDNTLVATDPRRGTVRPVYTGPTTKETSGGLMSVQEPVPALNTLGSVTPYPGSRFSLGADTRLMENPAGGGTPTQVVGAAPKPESMGNDAAMIAGALGINTDPRLQSTFEKQVIGKAAIQLQLMQPDQKAQALARPDLLWRVLGTPEPQGMQPQTGGTSLTIGADTRKANQAKDEAYSREVGGIQGKAANLPALESIAQATSQGTTAGGIQGRDANLPALMRVEAGETQARTEGANRVLPNKELTNYYNPQTNKFAYQDPSLNDGSKGLKDLAAAGYYNVDTELGGKEKFAAKQAQINTANSHLNNLNQTIMNLYRKGAIGDWDERNPGASEAKAQANRVWRQLVQQGDPDIQALETFRAVGLNVVAPFMPSGTRGGLGLLREIESGLPKSNSVGTLQSWQSAINATRLGLKSASLALTPTSEQGITGANAQDKLTPGPLPGPSTKTNYGLLPVPR